MTAPLIEHLRARIASAGPISLAEYMDTCLLHPQHGYYATRDPLGQQGDFITAPEISQMFGELIGLSLAQSWLDQGAPSPFALIEAGPGRGTLMADILRATRSVPGFHAAAQLHLIEASPTLRDIQRQTLQTLQPHWHDDFSDLPEMPLFFVANEFFDALPIRQYQRTESGWAERRVGLGQGDNVLTLGLAPPAPVAALDHRLGDTRPGDVVEICPQATPIAAALGAHIETKGGVAILIDYGDWRSLGDTLQALKNHEPTDPFLSPGQADLTAHVDFELLAQATPSAHSRLTAQGVFLERLGLVQRAQQLAENLRGIALETHISAFQRLTHPDEMGTLFKVLSFYPKGANPPPGLDP